MTKREFFKSLYLPTLTLKMGGIYLNYPKNMNWSQHLKWSWFFYFNLLTLGTDTIGEMVWFLNGARSGKSFVELTFNAPCIIFSILGFVKLYNLYSNKHILTDLIMKFEDMYPANSCDEGIKKIMKDSNDFLNPVIKITFYLNCVLVWSFNLLPLANMYLKYKNTGEIELLLPFLIAYPFNKFDIRIWPIVYVRQIWDGLFSTIGTVGSDTLYYACCSNLWMHFRILQRRMERSVAFAADPGARKNLGFMDQPSPAEWRVSTAEVDNDALRRNFIGLVKKHQELIGLVNQLEKLYSVSTLVNFGSSSILICLTGFNVMAIDASRLPTFLVFLMSSLSQIYVFCLFGDMIRESSEQVGSAIYCSHWYLTNLEVKKMMLFSLIRAQRACKLSALNFADINLNSFTRILSTSWSYFALLKTAYSPAE